MASRPLFSRGLQNAGGIIPLRARVQAEGACAEGGKLQEAASHSDVLEEMDHLVLIAQSVMKHRCRRDTIERDNERGGAGLRLVGRSSADTSSGS